MLLPLFAVSMWTTRKQPIAIATHGSYVVEINRKLVKLAVGELLQHIVVLVLGCFPLGPFLLAAIARLVVLVHEIIVVAEFIFVDCDVAEGGGERVLWRCLEVLEKRLERRCMKLRFSLATAQRCTRDLRLHCCDS